MDKRYTRRGHHGRRRRRANGMASTARSVQSGASGAEPMAHPPSTAVDAASSASGALGPTDRDVSPPC